MAFGFDSFDFGKVAVQLGISEGRKRRAVQKQERRTKRAAGAESQAAGEARRGDAKDRLALIRTQFGATSRSEQKGKLGEPTIGRRRLTV